MIISIFDDDNEVVLKKESTNEVKKKESTASKSVKIFVSGIKEETKSQDLVEFFQKSPSINILDIKIIRYAKIPDEYFGLVTIENELEASKCIENLNQSNHNGMLITLSKVSVVLDGIVHKIGISIFLHI